MNGGARGCVVDGRRTILKTLIALSMAGTVSNAEPASGREFHGASDAFAAEGVAIAWAILRAATADDATVVIRIARDVAAHPALGVVAVDPFSGQSQPVRAAAPAGGVVDIPSPRRRFADFPRTEVKLYTSVQPAPAEAPALTIFYLGVPDTTPEFDSEAKLRAWLDERIAKLRSPPGGKVP